MKVEIITVGSLRSSGLQGEEAEYLTRLKRSPLEVSLTEIRPYSVESANPEVIKKREGELIVKQLKSTDFLILLNERGAQVTSLAFSEWLQKRLNAAHKRLVFVIGGAYGLDPELSQKAQWELSLSSLTLPYQLARIMLVEQLYRATTLIAGAPYHKR